MLWQTVPSTGSSNMEGLIADGGRRRAVYDGQSATVRKQIEDVSGPRNRPCTRPNQRDTKSRYYVLNRRCQL